MPQCGCYLKVAQGLALTDPKGLLIAELICRWRRVDDGWDGLIRELEAPS